MSLFCAPVCLSICLSVWMCVCAHCLLVWLIRGTVWHVISLLFASISFNAESRTQQFFIFTLLHAREQGPEQFFILRRRRTKSHSKLLLANRQLFLFSWFSKHYRWIEKENCEFCHCCCFSWLADVTMVMLSSSATIVCPFVICAHFLQCPYVLW